MSFAIKPIRVTMTTVTLTDPKSQIAGPPAVMGLDPVAATRLKRGQWVHAAADARAWAPPATAIAASCSGRDGPLPGLRSRSDGVRYRWEAVMNRTAEIDRYPSEIPSFPASSQQQLQTLSGPSTAVSGLGAPATRAPTVWKALWTKGWSWTAIPATTWALPGYSDSAVSPM